MSTIDFSSPREAARAFTPKLTGFVEAPLFSTVWPDTDLAKRDRSLATVAALIAGGHANELPAHLRRAIENGVTKRELSGLITHLAFYVGFPGAITASAIATATLGGLDEPAEGG
jgi:4-carboxymuconolactone decarboxylase